MRRGIFALSIAVASAPLLFAGSAGATVIDNGTLASPGFYNGTGNPSNNFTIDTETVGSGTAELGLRARFRGGPNVVPNGNVYVFPTGAVSGRALWNYDFSINLSGTGLDLTGVTVKLSVFDAVANTTTVLNPAALADDAKLFSTGGTFNGGSITTGDVSGSVVGIQNSENLTFGANAGIPGFDAWIADQYTFTLELFNNNNLANPIATDQIEVDAVPEPASMALLGTALLGFGGIGWRRRRKG